jgi:hypothetical protein
VYEWEFSSNFQPTTAVLPKHGIWVIYPSLRKQGSARICSKRAFGRGIRGILVSPLVTHVAYDGEVSKNVREQVVRTLREFGFEPIGHTRSYRKPYHEFLTPCHMLEVLEF